MNFEVTLEDKNKINKWLLEEVYPAVVKQQQDSTAEPTPMQQYAWDEGFPYEGAIGGGVTYQFSPTSMGTVFTALYQNGEDEFKLNLTKYDEW